jgi:hypothetical protein
MSFDATSIKSPDLHDTLTHLQTFPSTFTLPSSQEFDALEVGMCVKVGVGQYGKGNGSESFWVELHAINPLDGLMLGIIVNQLTFTDKHHLAARDMILVRRNNVFAISD